MRHEVFHARTLNPFLYDVTAMAVAACVLDAASRLARMTK